MSEKETQEVPDEEKPKPKQKKVTLELGDIIQIQAPQNAELHENTFLILYLDDAKIDMANVSTFHPVTLKLDKDGHCTDETIRQIIILSRNEIKGYARQHMLLPKTWLNIHFGGEVPVVITGEITNLEEDMIEITTFPDLQTIYIDFEYKGLPEHLPIEIIELRSKPAALNKISSLINIRDQMEEGEVIENFDDFVEDDATLAYSDAGEMIIHLPENAAPAKNVRDVLRTMYLDANEIQFGEELEDIVQVVEIPESRKKYGIETQVNDMMDELLSDIPHSKRSKSVLDNIHYLIERFRELRNQFSKFDENGNIYDALLLGAFHKPLVDRISKLDTNLKWLVPVVALRRKIYTEIAPETTSDVVQLNQREIMNEEFVLQEDYYKNQIRGDKSIYDAFYEKNDETMRPFTDPQYPENYLLPKQKVATDLESIVNNLTDLYSTVIDLNDKREGYNRRRFVVQRYNLGYEKLAKKSTGKKVFFREPLTENDSMTMTSLMVMPDTVMKFSSILLAGTSLLDQAALSQRYLYMFRVLRKNAEILQNVVREFGKEMDETFWQKPEHLKQIQEFVLDESLEKDPRRFRRFLEAVIPKTSTVIEIMRKNTQNRFSMKQVVDQMESFDVHMPDITYQQYNQIRFFIKESVKEFRAQYAKRGDEFARLRSTKYPLTEMENRMERLFFEKKEIADIFLDNYRVADGTRRSESEIISHVLQTDNGRLFFNLIRFMTSSLIIPESLLAPLQDDGSDEMSKNDKIVAKDCVRRFITKKYTSLKELQKENGENDIYYGEEYDDSPYELIKKYKEDEKKYSPEDFVEYIAENLIQKHDCPQNIAKELAVTLIAGKKRVNEGEYAVLEMKPQLPANIDESKLSSNEQKELQAEANIRKRLQYYRRVKNQWVHDSSVDEDSFIDNNTLFCNMGKICFKNQKTKTCDAIPHAEERMKQMARTQMLKEFDGRFVDEMETLQDRIKTELEENMHKIKNARILKDILLYKQNRYAFELGKFAKKDEVIRSPHLEILDRILAIGDFVKHQTDILRFVEMFCRDPMVDELGDSPYWLYCKDTNTQLLPTFKKLLAQEFLSGGNYQQKVDEICRKQGVRSEDGGSIQDRYGGGVIRYIDFVEEDGYDENGFKIVTNEVIEKDAGEVLLEMLRKKKDRVFESEIAGAIYRVYSTMSRNMDIPMESIEEFVLRISQEVIQKNIDSEDSYNKMSDKMEKAKGKRPISYKLYKNQRILMIVAGVMLIGIQTVIPSFKVRKTFPGCIQSFGGYPMDMGTVEDKSGIKYITCVMKKTGSAVEPWDSIKNIPVEILQERIYTVISTYILDNYSEITELYAKKREYIATHPEEEAIPKEHSIDKWRHFLPPIVAFSVNKGLKPLSSDHKSEMLSQMREGKMKQREHIGTFKTKILQYGYGVIESINAIVHKKETLLKTMSKVPFLENACCNDRNSARSIDYFIGEDETIDAHIKAGNLWSHFLEASGAAPKAAQLYHKERTGLVLQKDTASEHFEENVYLAFIHYCNLDREQPIPNELTGIMPEKPVGYNPKWTLTEKIDFLKENGKRYTLANLMQLMEVVNRENYVGVYSAKDRGIITSATSEFLTYLDGRDSTVLEAPLRKLLEKVIDKFNPREMIFDDPAKPLPESFELNSYLSLANENMKKEIIGFMEKNGRQGWNRRAKLQKILEEIHSWDFEKEEEDNMYTVIQFIKNSVYNMSRLYPEIIYNNHKEMTKVHDHWNLAGLHITNIRAFLRKHYELLQEFKNDRVMGYLIRETQDNLVDLNMFLQTLPFFAPIHRVFIEEGTKEKTPMSWYALFSKRTIYMLLTHVWYATLMEYIKATDNDELIYTDILDGKEARRAQIRENMDTFTLGETESELTPDSDLAEYNEDLLEVDIKKGDKKLLKTRVAGLLAAFLEMEMSVKSSLDISYFDLDKKIHKSKQIEKKRITDFFRNKDDEERRVEDEKKMLKLGRWNVGMQKGLVQYDKATYEREVLEMMSYEQMDANEEAENQVARDVNDLNREGEEDDEAFYDREANDIEGLGEEYGDGNYYEEDNTD